MDDSDDLFVHNLCIKNRNINQVIALYISIYQHYCNNFLGLNLFIVAY